MSSYDLHFPKDKYDETEKALLTAGEACLTKSRQAERSTDRSTRLQATQHRSQRERYSAVVAELTREKAIQERVYKYTTEAGGRLEQEKNHWFSHGTSIHQALAINMFIISL